MTAEMEKWAKNQNAIIPVISLFWFIVVIALVIWFFSGGIAQHLAEDYEIQYKIALQSGEWIDARYAASMAALFYLDAHDDYNYKKWKNLERDMDIRIEKQKREE